MIELTANKTPPRLSNDGGESNSSKYSNKLLSQPHKAIIRQRDSKPEHMDPSSPKYIDLNVRKDQRKKSLVHFILREVILFV